ncbi:hypothetical protein [Inquilinus sp.]|jgi:hypothetical protein|uniref:lipase family protein n=1 Tax=Inquilinus sp. TaxID=1932117 RepID=UPI0037830591
MPDYSTTQIMMTLAALAPDGATKRPSGETQDQHIARISKGIAAQLAEPGLATQGQWSLKWVGLTQDGANLAYLTQGPNDSNGSVYALVLRGTVMGDLTDLAEDMQVGGTMPNFTAGGAPPNGLQPKISQGAKLAFDHIVGTDLLTQFVVPGRCQTLYVVGHSLGGAMATTIALFLQQQVSDKVASIGKILPYTFAAPTSGDAAFAAWFDQQFPNAVCTYNKYDVVPNAWATLASLPIDWQTNPFYPGRTNNPPGPGPTATPDNDVGKQIASTAAGTKGNIYVQPTQQPPLNSGPSPTFLPSYPPTVTAPMDQFKVQLGFQHASNTYLGLLNAPLVPSYVPAVASVSPTSGPLTGDTSVTILPQPESRFTRDCVVDFGIIAAKSLTVAADGSSIIAKSPGGLGTVDIRVTNIYGTSAAVPADPNLSGKDYSDKFTFKL